MVNPPLSEVIPKVNEEFHAKLFPIYFIIQILNIPEQMYFEVQINYTSWCETCVLKKIKCYFFTLQILVIFSGVNWSNSLKVFEFFFFFPDPIYVS